MTDAETQHAYVSSVGVPVGTLGVSVSTGVSVSVGASVGMMFPSGLVVLAFPSVRSQCWCFRVGIDVSVNVGVSVSIYRRFQQHLVLPSDLVFSSGWA